MTSTPTGKNELKVLAVISLAGFLFFNSLGNINVALPAIQRDFSASLAAGQWVVIMGAVMLSTVSVCFGRASGILGGQRLFIIGVTLYSLGAGLSAAAESLPQLLAYRGIMTFGLAMAVPMGPAILATTFPLQRRGQALGIYASASAVGQATGPTTGGLILSAWDWRAIFLVNLILGLLISLAVFRVLKGQEERKGGPFDFKGAALLLIGYPALLIALSLGNGEGWGSPQVITLFAIAAAGLTSFVAVELKASHPLINLFFFRNLVFTAAILAAAATSIVWQPVNFFAPLYLGNVLNVSAIMLGLIMSALPAFTVFASPVSGRFADRFDPRFLVSGGLAITLLGAFLYSRLGVDPSYFLVVIALALVGLGYGLLTPANQTMAFSIVPREQYALISAMLLSLGVAAGNVGNTIAVALAEDSLAGRRIQDAIGFADAQEFAFSWLLPVAALAILIPLLKRARGTVEPLATSTTSPVSNGTPPD